MLSHVSSPVVPMVSQLATHLHKILESEPDNSTTLLQGRRPFKGKFARCWGVTQLLHGTKLGQLNFVPRRMSSQYL